MKEKRCYGCMKLKENEGICPICGYDDSIPNEPHQLPAGTVLKEQYLIGRVLGQGGFGITYMGWDLYLNIPVAIKEYFPNGAVMRNCRETTDVISYSGEVGVRFRNNKERFMREVKMLARFSDTREIVQVKTFFLANNTAYIVMEYVEGITLKEYVRGQGGRLEPERTLELLRPVMEALAKVHKSGLVHRDISPDNIMIQADGSVKLLDFGAVRDVGEAVPGKALTKSTEAILKQGYAPIEQYQSHGSLGPWTDVYAFCATIYYCLTGEVPPDAPERILGEELAGLREKGVSVSANMEKVILDGMALRIADRIGDMDTLCRRLFAQDDEEDAAEAAGAVKTAENVKAEESGLLEAQDPGAKVKTEAGAETTAEAQRRKRKIGVAAAVYLCIIALCAGIYGISSRREESTAAGSEVAGSGDAASAEVSSGEAEPMETELLQGSCGDQVTFEFDTSSGVMTLSGQGGTWGFFVEEPWVAEGDSPYDREVPWKEYRAEIRTLVIEPGVTEIGHGAFTDCVNLTEVDWGTVQNIDAHTFRNTGLTRVELPDSVTRIGDFAFNRCGSLSEVSVGSGVEEILIGAFSETAVGTVTLNDHVVLEERDVNTPFFDEDNVPEDLVIHAYVGSSAEEFAARYHIPFVSQGFAEGYTVSGQCGDDVFWELDLASGRLSLIGTGKTWDYRGNKEENPDWKEGFPEWYAYRNYVRELTVDPRIIRIGHDLFGGCGNLTSVDLGNVEEIGVCCFSETGIVSLELPDSVRVVEDYAFGGSALQEITFPEGMEEIRGGFSWCYSLERFTVLGKNTRLEISEGDHGIFMEYDETPDGKPENVVVYGIKGSGAEIVAQEEGIPFIALDEE